jgi:hypothetical protein
MPSYATGKNAPSGFIWGVCAVGFRIVTTVEHAIASPAAPAGRLGGWARLLALGISLAALGMLATAATLPPSPSGVGTHQKLGFAECQFLQLSRLPCPTCGMTTSAAWFVRGNWLASFYVQPIGFVIALSAGAAFWVGIYIAA